MRTIQQPHYIDIDEIYVGLYVHLDLNWMEHDFVRGSFKIKSASEITAIRKLGLNRIRVDLTLSDLKFTPAPPPASVPAANKAPALKPNIAAPASKESETLSLRQGRIERLDQQLKEMAHCKKEFLKASKTLKNISLNIFSRPKEARKDADQLVEQMLASLLTDKNIAIHLMNDKSAGEDNYYHSLNVAVLAMLLGKELDVSEEEIKLLGVGCMFHDIGKVEIPNWLVQKSTTLTRAEKNLLQQHCQYGIPIAQKLELPQGALDIILQHHECIDGSGFPNHLQGEKISKLARIVAIVNAYDNHCNRPNPADSLSPYEALSTMFARQRTLFDTGPLNVFIHCMGVYPPGTIVRLSDNAIGMVISVNSGTPLRPSVLIYDPAVPKEEAMILDLINEPELTIIANLKPKQLAPEIFEYLSPRKRMMYYFDKPKTDAR